MKKLYIHIGNHKTGTTSIQGVLKNSKNLLESHGLSYFSTSPNGELMQAGNSWVSACYNDIKQGRTGKIVNPSLLSKMLGECKGDVVFSSENLSWIFDINEIILLKSALDLYFDQFEIICYLRRQDKQIVSHKLQGAKHKGATNSAYYDGDYYAIPVVRNNYDEYLDYNKRIGLWADVFGDKSITLKVYERTELLRGDVVDDFLELMGIEYINDEIEYNKTTSLVDTKIGLIANSFSLGCLDAIIRENGDNSDKMSPSKEQAKCFYNKYLESNIALSTRFRVFNKDSIFDDDFSNYPECQKDIFTNDTAVKSIEQIFSNLEVVSQLLRPEDLYFLVANGNDQYHKSSIRALKLAMRLTPDKNKNLKAKIRELLNEVSRA
ncbi:lipocalin/fatty acid-binding family protein [Vibrio astriarenae]|uniref:hypothetical protein n=1 Tax=Vibrio astriarenae TaxID=1481923 RepID=UPI0037350833